MHTAAGAHRHGGDHQPARRRQPLPVEVHQPVHRRWPAAHHGRGPRDIGKRRGQTPSWTRAEGTLTARCRRWTRGVLVQDGAGRIVSVNPAEAAASSGCRRRTGRGAARGPTGASRTRSGAALPSSSCRACARCSAAKRSTTRSSASTTCPTSMPIAGSASARCRSIWMDRAALPVISTFSDVTALKRDGRLFGYITRFPPASAAGVLTS